MARFLEFDREVIAEVNGKTVTRGQSMDVKFKAMCLEHFRAMELYLRMRGVAEAREQEIRQQMLLAAHEHCDRYLRAAIQCEERGTPFTILPNPLDIHICGGEVRIDGPCTVSDQLAMEEAVRRRDALHGIVVWMRSSKMSHPAQHEMWLKLRRKHYRLSRIIPKRLKVPFPPLNE